MTVFEQTLLQRAYQLSKDADDLAGDLEQYFQALPDSVLKAEPAKRAKAAPKAKKVKEKAAEASCSAIGWSHSVKFKG